MEWLAVAFTAWVEKCEMVSESLAKVEGSSLSPCNLQIRRNK